MSEERLQALLEALTSEDQKERLNACKILGKLGNPSAIPQLSRVYQQDVDSKVRQAAENALKKFAQQEVKEAGGGGSRVWRMLASLLGMSFMVLVVLNVILRLGGGVEPIDDPSDLASLLTTYQDQHLLPALDDLNNLRTEFEAGAGNMPCSATLKSPALITLKTVDSYAYPDLFFVESLNYAITEVNGVGMEWQQACRGSKGTPNQLQNLSDRLFTAESILIQVAEALAKAQASPAPTNQLPTAGPVPSTPVPTATTGGSATPTHTPLPTESPIPSITPLPTFDTVVIRDLDSLIRNTMTELNSIMSSRWAKVQAGEASPFGCAEPNLEASYTTPAGTFPPELTILIDAVNQALVLANASADSYVAACQTQNFTPQIIQQGMSDAQQALDLLTLVKEGIDTQQGRTPEPTATTVPTQAPTLESTPES